MKKHNLILNIVLFSLFINLSTPLIAEETQNQNKENQTTEKKDEIPQSLKDIRRFEIITLGSLPFVFLDASLVYSGVRYFSNGMDSDFAPSFNPNFSQEEQLGLILTSVGISVGIGLTDLIINIVKRNKQKKRQELREKPILIMPISEDPDATKIELPEQEHNSLNEDIKSDEENDLETSNENETIEINEDN